MKLLYISILLAFIATMLFSVDAKSQEKLSARKLYTESVKYFNNEEYEKALSILLTLDSIEPNNYETKYYIGACYLNSKNSNSKQKAIPYLEFAINKAESAIPPDIYYDLGELYHENYQFEKAVSCLKKYQRMTPTNSVGQINVKRKLEYCKNAVKMVKDSVDAKIEKLENFLNSPNAESNPYISADEATMVFQRSVKLKGLAIDSISEILISTKANGKWTLPKLVTFDKKELGNNVSIAGLSNDGGYLYLNYNNDLYGCKLEGEICNDLFELKNINSDGTEENISASADNKEYYFSSDRLGGFGGKDIYKVVVDEKGNWSQPTNLGLKVNTPYDEISPYIHPDNKTLYFCSKGHNTMGGFDVFKTIQIQPNQWTKPVNLGYPINTPKDDKSFVISAKGQDAYIIRQAPNSNSNTDIYKVSFKNTVPITLVKGTITSGIPPQPIAANIRVIDKETNELVKYVYNPNPQTGKFLMIFPPGKNYDMIIEAKGYLPQLINIYIPNQTYFYELFQEINLRSVKSLGKVVGEEIIVKNIFYDIYKNTGIEIKADSTKKDYSTLLQIVEDIISTTDTIGMRNIDNLYTQWQTNKNMPENKNYNNLIDLISKAIEETDTATLSKIDKDTKYDDKTKQSYFYAENKQNKDLVPYVLNGDTIYTIPPVNTVSTEKQLVAEEISNVDSTKTAKINVSESIQQNRKNILTFDINFPSGNYVVNDKYLSDMMEISQLVVNNTGLGIEIISYSTEQDIALAEFSMSKKRITAVVEKLSENGILSRHYVSKEISDKQKSNTVQLKIFEIISTDTVPIIIETKKVEKKETEIPPVVVKEQPKDEIVFKVQIKATLKQLELNDKEFKGLKVSRYYHGGLYKYVVGNFKDIQAALVEREAAVKAGFDDAFVVAFKNDIRIDIKEALILKQK